MGFFGPKRMTRQKIVERFNWECQEDIQKGRPMEEATKNAFDAEQKTIAFEITRYSLTYMRTHVNAKLTHEHTMAQHHLASARDFQSKGNDIASISMSEKASQCSGRMRVCNAFFRAVKDVVEK